MSNIYLNQIKQKLLVIFRYLFSRFPVSSLYNGNMLYELIILKRSKLFEKNWYLNQYSDVKESLTNPMIHYLRYGWVEGRNPSERFITNAYLEQYPDVKKSNICPVLHYYMYGRKEGRNIQSISVSHDSFCSMRKEKRFEYNNSINWLTLKKILLRFLIDFYRSINKSNLKLYIKLGPSELIKTIHRYIRAYANDDQAKLILNNCSFENFNQVKISVIMPVYNTPSSILNEAIKSVLNQKYDNWELCICDDCSTSMETVTILNQYRGIDPRIKILRSPKNLHIAGASNFIVEQATGSFLAFLDHDDLLSCDALLEVAIAVNNDPTIDLLYSDEDKIDKYGNFVEPYFKPDWSPEHLNSVMYVLHLLVVRKSIFLYIGGFRSEYSGAQDYDLSLRISKIARKIHHIPRILYHWRMIPGSAAEVIDAKPDALICARRALEDAVCHPIKAIVENGLLPGTFRVRWNIIDNPKITLLITTNDGDRKVLGRGNINLCSNFISSILEKSSYKNIQILVIDNGNISQKSRKIIYNAGGTIESFLYVGEFNFARKINFGLSHVHTNHVILLNDDLEVISSDWIEALLEYSQISDIGVVGARLYFADNSIQHAGIVLDKNNICRHVFYNFPCEKIGYYGFSHIIRNYSAVTGAVMATRMDVVNKVGGFDELFAIDYNDIDYCLRTRYHGYRVVYSPYSCLYHFERSTAKRSEQNPKEKQLFCDRWKRVIESDPYNNLLI